MKYKKRTLRILIASPGDVANERQAIRDVIKNINYWAIFANIEFETLDWENNSFPSIGEYPQEVINKQFRGKYDILIGVFWSKIGTRTPNYDSGSIEEIEIAIEKYRKQKDVEIMLYFKLEHIPEHEIELNQIESLNNFKSSLSNRGIYYWDFQNTGDFKNYLSQHLALLVQHRYWNNSKDKIDIKSISDEEIYDSPSDSFRNALEHRKLIHEIISLLALFHKKEARLQGEENRMLNELLSFPKSKSVFDEVKDVMDESALRIREQSIILDKELKDIKTHFIKMFHAYSNSILMNAEMEQNERKDLIISINGLIVLRNTFLGIKKEVDKSIELLKIEIKDSRYPAYSRAIKEYLKIKINYSDIFRDSIYLMNELEKSVANLK